MSPAERPPSSTAPGSGARGDADRVRDGGGNGAGGNGSGGAVSVLARTEQALADAQRRLLEQAREGPPARTGGPAIPPGGGRRGRSLVDDDEVLVSEEFWGRARPARTVNVVDTRRLTLAERRALGKLRARKVRRIVRHISPWSVFKFSLLFYLCLWLILMVAGTILWRVGQDAGVVHNAERFYAKASGESSFEIDGRGVFRAGAGAGVVLVFAGTAFTVLMTILFNLITDLTGGIRMSVLELETARRDLKKRAVASLEEARVDKPAGSTSPPSRARGKDRTSTRPAAARRPEGETDGATSAPAARVGTASVTTD